MAVVQFAERIAQRSNDRSDQTDQTDQGDVQFRVDAIALAFRQSISVGFGQIGERS
jgi:hypothetical protein